MDDFKIKVNKWLEKFLSVYQVKNVTPHIHLLTCHIPQFLKKYGTIALFSQQGLEKLNDVITKDYFRGTNHRNCLTQILLKLNCLEELSDEGYVRSKEVYTCKSYKQQGHNIRTCKFRASDNFKLSHCDTTYTVREENQLNGNC